MVVIVGAGIAGAATAFYLTTDYRYTNNNDRIILIDAVGPAAAASGNAGAFLSEAWGDGTKTQELHQSSFHLHESLAQELGLESFQYVANVHRNVDVESLKNDGDIFASNSNLEGKAALVDPCELTTSMIGRMIEHGGQLQIGSVDDIIMDGGYATEISFDDGESLSIQPEEPLVIAMGPWSSRLEDWIQQPVPVEGVSSTFLQWDNGQGLLQQNRDTSAIFCKEDSNGCHLEIFQRPARKKRSLYVSGCGGSESINPASFRSPDRPHPIRNPPKPNISRSQAALSSLNNIGNNESSICDPTKIGACIRPVTPDGLPIVGKLNRSKNMYLVTGGGPWGISWGPIMGKVMAAILTEEDPPIRRLSQLSPERYNTLVYKTLMDNRGGGGATNNKAT